MTVLPMGVSREYDPKGNPLSPKPSRNRGSRLGAKTKGKAAQTAWNRRDHEKYDRLVVTIKEDQ